MDLKIIIRKSDVSEMFAHARESLPQECCGLLGGSDSTTKSVYRLSNVAPNPLTRYEAAPEELFSSQRTMRSRGEELAAIYHSHPGSDEPVPSSTDIRLAFYPSATYLIIGFTKDREPILRAFRITAGKGTWQSIHVEISDAE